MRYSLLLIVCLLATALYSQKSRPYKAKEVEKYGRNDLDKLPMAPDYSDRDSWIAHPDEMDMADTTPGKGEIRDGQTSAQVDVFFVYPTIYAGKQQEANPWNADVKDEKLNDEIASSTIKNQATVFNGSARIYAPLYRQAHYNVFLTKDLILKQRALDHAYKDVKAAFEYYLQHLNQQRPIIIASHSQGTLHAARLIQEFFDGKALSQQLVAAYLVGMPLAFDSFEDVEPCQSASENGCFVSWNTYARDWYPESFKVRYQNAVSTNPLNWRLDESYAPASKNQGAVLRNFNSVKAGINDAQNHRGVLWISKPKFFGNFLMNWKRYHIADYNLFYLNVRENVRERVEAFLSQ